MSAQTFKIINVLTTLAFFAAVGYAFMVADDLDLTLKIVAVAIVVSIVESIAYRRLVKRG
jgi:hypothetical protein